MTVPVAVTYPITRRYCSAVGDKRPSGGQTLTALLPPTEDSRREPTISKPTLYPNYAEQEQVAAPAKSWLLPRSGKTDRAVGYRGHVVGALLPDFACNSLT